MSLRRHVCDAAARTDEAVAHELDNMEEMDRVVEDLVGGNTERGVDVEERAMPFHWDSVGVDAGNWGGSANEGPSENYLEPFDSFVEAVVSMSADGILTVSSS